MWHNTTRSFTYHYSKTLYLTIMKIVHCPFKTRPYWIAKESVLCRWTKWNICWSSDEELLGFFADGTWTEKRRHASTRRQTRKNYLVYISIPLFILATRRQKRNLPVFFFFPHNNEILNALFCLCHKIFFFSCRKSVKKKVFFFARASFVPLSLWQPCIHLNCVLHNRYRCKSFHLWNSSGMKKRERRETGEGRGGWRGGEEGTVK